MRRTFSRGLCDSSSGCVLMSATLLPCTGLKASQREWMLSSLLAMCVCAYGLVPVPTMPSYGTLCVPAHTHEQTWPSYICSGENVTWDCAVRCQHIMEFEKNPAGRRHTKTACKRMRAHTHAQSRAPRLWTLRGKIQLFVCLGNSASVSPHFAHSKKKSFYYLKHGRVNNKRLIQPAPYLCFLFK